MSGSGEGPAGLHHELVEASPVPMAVYDADRVLRYVNEAAVEFVNAPGREAVVGRRATEFVHPDHHDPIDRRFERVLEEREPVESAELRFLATDGEEKRATVAGAPVTYEGEPAGQAVLKDVTEQKRRERQLRLERDRFELLFENLPSAVVKGVARDGKPIVERVNRRFEEVFGYDREEIEGENLDEYIVPEDGRAAAERLNERILSEGRVQTEVTRMTSEGPREFLLHIVMDDLEGDRPEGYSIYTDITDRRRTERELARQNERLEELVSVVAHDLRNPLNVARGYAEIAAEEAESDAVERVLTAHERMEEIVDDLLKLARQGERISDPRPVDLRTVATRAWSTVRTGEADLQVAGTGRVLADASRLQELLENLFRNAVEHGSTGNRTESDDAGGDGDGDPGSAVTVELGVLDDGFYVADDGPGIPPEHRDRVFESGFTTADEGTGFGLPIVRRIAEAHGWTVSVTESEAGGARFEVVGVDTPQNR